jgi:hypothetical protein
MNEAYEKLADNDDKRIPGSMYVIISILQVHVVFANEMHDDNRH